MTGNGQVKPLVATKGSDYELPPEEPSMAVCVWVIDLGTSENIYGNLSRQVLIGWELVDELMQDGRPFLQSKFYTLSLNEKANLRKDLEAWRNKPFTKEEEEGFALRNLLGAWCNLGIAHEQKNGKTRAKITSISGLTKSQKERVKNIKIHNDLLYFDFADYMPEVYERIPEWVKKIINRSVEWQHLQMSGAPDEWTGDEPDGSENYDPETPEIDDEEIPF